MSVGVIFPADPGSSPYASKISRHLKERQNNENVRRLRRLQRTK